MITFCEYKGVDIDSILIDKYHNYITLNENSGLNGHGWRHIASYIGDELQNLYRLCVYEDYLTVEDHFYVALSIEEMNAFLNYCFTEYGIKKIIWKKLLTRLPVKSAKYPAIEVLTEVDNIATLPATYTEYLNRLGKQTKKHAKYYIGRIVRDFPTTSFLFKEGIDVTDDEFGTICAHSEQRIINKGVPYSRARDNKYRLAIKYKTGFGFFVKIDGKIQAGCIGHIVGEHLYLNKISNNVEFNHYNLGNVALLKLIETVIDKGVIYFHFLWARNVDYKSRFGGVETPVFDYTFYRKKCAAYYDQKVKDLLSCVIQKMKGNLSKNPSLQKIYRKMRYRK